MSACMHERVCMSVCVCACVYELKVCSQAFCDCVMAHMRKCFEINIFISSEKQI